VGYETLEAEGRVLALLVEGRRVAEVHPGAAVEVICDRTPFYAQAGGQVGDTGTIDAGPGASLDVEDTQRPAAGLIVHRGRVRTGMLREGDRVRLAVDPPRRWDIMRNHTATHLLHAALREVLGEHARQAGSLVAPDRLRFDFAHMHPLSADERARIEARVNEQILAAVPVTTEIRPYREAVASGAMALFGEKYADEVRVVGIDGYSRELCGGTHVRTTAEIGLFLLTSEASVGAGIRRIEAVTGRAAVARARDAEAALRAAAEILHVSPDKLPARVRVLAERVHAAERQAPPAAAEPPDLETLLQNATEVDGITVIGVAVPRADASALRALGDRLRERLDSGVLVAASAGNGRLEVIVMATAAAVARGVEARRVMQVLNRRLGTRGGGRPELAQGGGGDPQRLAPVLADLGAVVREALTESPRG
jgi:alanyl-tRNA synthetase